MITFGFDTETTGLPTDWKSDHTHEGWPDVIQFGMVVLDGRQPIFEMGCLVQNPLKPIEADAQSVHGISVALCDTWGQDRRSTVTTIEEWMRASDRIVAHNAGFDVKVWRALLHRLGWDNDPSAKIPIVCTMKSSVGVCKIPSNHGAYKWPKLDEAYRKLVDPHGFPDAHNASADVWAAIRILWALEDGGVNLVGI